MSNIKIGDVVPWADVPDGALVRTRTGALWARRGDYYQEAYNKHCEPLCACQTCKQVSVTVVALGLTGQESADELRRLAEVFEVREAVCRDIKLAAEAVRAWLRDPPAADGVERIPTEQESADRLHAAGWRPGMTAEDAARLLAQTGP